MRCDKIQRTQKITRAERDTQLDVQHFLNSRNNFEFLSQTTKPERFAILNLLEISLTLQIGQRGELVLSLDNPQQCCRFLTVAAHLCAALQIDLDLLNEPVGRLRSHLGAHVPVERRRTTTLLHVPHDVAARTEQTLSLLRIQPVHEIRRVVLVGFLV